jgi:hydrogenase-4 component B
MRTAMLLLAWLCTVSGLGGTWLVRLMAPALALLMPAAMPPDALQTLSGMLAWIGWAGLGLIVCTAALLRLRAGLLRRRDVRQDETWGCGYAAPSARMQYSASSFVQPIGAMFAAILRTRQELHAPKGIFPAGGSLHTETPDLFVRTLFVPAVRQLMRLAVAFRNLQQGRTHLCILYIVATLMLLLIWNLG